MHLQVYIDTNVFLRLLATQAQVTAEMAKFLALCENGAVQLYLPQQTEEEYLSNREDVIAATIKELQKASNIGGFPPLVESHESGLEVAAVRRDLATKIQAVADWYTGAAKRCELPFDRWFGDLRKTGTRIDSAEELIAKASHRAAMHMPPGKGEDLGDRLIWECLLKAGEFCDDLHLITDDRHDFRCPLDPKSVRKKLLEEWDTVNWGTLFIYESIDELLQLRSRSDAFTQATEIGRAIWLIRNHTDAGSIAGACDILRRYMSQLSLRQAKLIAAAARTYYDAVFITDDSFDSMITEFFAAYGRHLDSKECEQVNKMLPPEAVEYRPAANAN